MILLLITYGNKIFRLFDTQKSIVPDVVVEVDSDDDVRPLSPLPVLDMPSESPVLLNKVISPSSSSAHQKRAREPDLQQHQGQENL